MSQCAGDALTDMSYYREVPGEDGQHATYARSISAALPNNFTGKVAHGRSGVEGSAVTNNPRRTLRERLPQGMAET